MKENDNNSSKPSGNNLGVWNDPELEARLVAMLMGELSPFEEAEMEQELERSPELRLFRDRMLEVQGLITEVNKQDKQSEYKVDWSLSSERRSSLLENFNEDKPERVQPEVKLVATSTSSIQWGNVFSVAACLVISLAAFMMMFLRKGKVFYVKEELVTYSANMEAEEGIEIVGGTSRVLPVKGKRKIERGERGSDLVMNSEYMYSDDETYGSSSIIKPEMSNEVAMKPSLPSSDMAKVIAANSLNPKAVPVPYYNLVAEPSLDFGSGDDFGDGWGDGGVNGAGRVKGGFVYSSKGRKSNDLSNTYAAINGLKGNLQMLSAKQGDQIPIIDPTEKIIQFNGKKYSGRSLGAINSFNANSTSPLGWKQLLDDDQLRPIDEFMDARVLADGLLSYSTNENPKFTGAYASWEGKGNDESKNSYAWWVGDSSAKSDIQANGKRSGDFALSLNGIDDSVDHKSKLDSGAHENSLVQAEVARRGLQVAESDKAILEGRKAYSDRSYEEAVDKYKSALALLPQGPIAEDRRREYTGHLLDGSIALSQQHRRVGKYAEARELLDGVLQYDPGNVVAKKHLEYLDDPIRTSPTHKHKHVKDVEQVRKLLYRAHSYYDQAQFDHATLEFKEVLRKDPYNKAARRGMEKVSSAKKDYYRAAYDQTRAAMLSPVDTAWEIAVPPNLKIKEEKRIPGGRKSSALGIGKSGSESNQLFTQKELNERRLDAIETFKMKRKLQEDKVEDHRSRLYALSKRLQIPYHGKDARFYAGRGSDANEHDRADQAYEEAKRTKNQLESFVNSLNGLNEEDLKVTLLASGRPEAAVLATGYNQLSAYKKNKEVALASGLAGNHKTIKSLDVNIKEIEERLDRSTISVRKKLTEDLVVFNQNVEKLRLDSNKEEGDLMVGAQEKTKFGKVREDYERELAILDAIKQAEFSEKLLVDIEKEVVLKKTTPDFSKEISAEAQTHSTFSLNVSDVSYKLAKSVLLEKGGMPEPAKIRVEEFVNAFDYGDPSASGKKVNCVVEQCAHPFYQQRNLMRIGMKTGAMGRSQPLRLTVLLDNSGSMEREDRAATVVKAVEALASQLGPQDEITLLSFARDARLVAQKVKGDQAHKLVDIVKTIPSEGGTNLSLAIEQAYTTAKQSLQEGTMSRIVLITDGAANLGNADPEDLSKSIERMRQNGIAFDACGVGADGLDDDMLEALTRKGDGRYYFINKPEDADAGFAQKLAGALRPAAKNVKVQVVFNPERVGNYRLVGFEKHRLKKEDFRNDTVDAAEMAAEEAGNALYQVEARPDGTGDVGTVFVRFRDMATGQMVERSWAIPYEPSIKNLTSAAPSMQLATVAGMLGERLKLGEEAGIDLKQIKPIFGKLRSHFHADKEVKDLIRMCEKVNR